jgi:hypothetical protein
VTSGPNASNASAFGAQAANATRAIIHTKRIEVFFINPPFKIEIMVD